MTETAEDANGETVGDNVGMFLCWGSGEFGQHCHGHKKEISFSDGSVNRFNRIMNSQIKLFGCGSSHTVVVTNTNEIYVWGNGNSGQLGCNDRNTHVEPQRIDLYTKQSSVPDVSGVSCGGRHTMIWLENGHVFCFGNNFHAQLGYDFRSKNYKENQADAFWDIDGESEEQFVLQPQLLKFLTYRHVSRVACGDKHSMFLFKDGVVALVGNNAHGQIGSGNREEVLTPKTQDDLQQSIKYIAAGSNHSLVVTDSGETYCWGYGKACGDKTQDLLSPRKVSTHRKNVRAVAGGSTHSVALTENGSVYTWGAGSDGQLGQGEKVRFLSNPHRVQYRQVSGRTVQIACGEMFTAAVTEKGYLYMWGKNSHIINLGKPTSYKIYHPNCMNRHYRPGRVSHVQCGSWHACAVLGTPEQVAKSGDESDDSLEEQVPESPDWELEQTVEETGNPDADKAVYLGDSDDSEREEIELNGTGRPRDGMISREKTRVSIAEFYAPTPDPQKTFRSPSPEYFLPNSEENGVDGGMGNRETLESARSKTLVVQMPIHPLFVDEATSPMTYTTTTNSTQNSSSNASHSRIPSPVSELKPIRADFRKPKPERKFRDSIQPTERERPKAFVPSISEVVQISKSSADAFTLPREKTTLTKRHVDFAEMEEARLHGPIRSPEKHSRHGRRSKNSDVGSSKSDRESGSARFLDSPSKNKLRNIDSSMSLKSDSVLMESPLFRGSKGAALGKIRRPWDTQNENDKPIPPPRIPRPNLRRKNAPKPTETNFGLQISRSKTIVGPVSSEAMIEQADRLAQLRRYASMHNPQSTGLKVCTEKVRATLPRHVSIPGGRAEDAPNQEDRDRLCVEGLLQSTVKPTFSSGSAWRDRSDIDRLQAVTGKKGVSAGIVKMYIQNNEVVGTMEKQWYPNLIENTQKGETAGNQEEVLIVQPLLKNQTKFKSLENLSLNIQPDMVKNGNKHAKRIRRRHEPIDLEINVTARSESYLDSRTG